MHHASASRAHRLDPCNLLRDQGLVSHWFLQSCGREGGRALGREGGRAFGRAVGREGGHSGGQ